MRRVVGLGLAVVGLGGCGHQAPKIPVAKGLHRAVTKRFCPLSEPQCAWRYVIESQGHSTNSRDLLAGEARHARAEGWVPVSSGRRGVLGFERGTSYLTAETRENFLRETRRQGFMHDELQPDVRVVARRLLADERARRPALLVTLSA